MIELWQRDNEDQRYKHAEFLTILKGEKPRKRLTTRTFKNRFFLATSYYIIIIYPSNLDFTIPLN